MSGPGGTPAPLHLAQLRGALDALDAETGRIERWGARIATALAGGARLLAVGNGGSAAQAQHLTSELVGRFEDERRALSAIALCVDTASLTAIGNDFGVEEMFSRQVRAHGRDGDVLVALSTSGSSPNVLAAVETARALGMATLGLTGRGGALARHCDDVLRVPAARTATVQECHLVAVHLLCLAVDAALRDGAAATRARLRAVAGGGSAA